LVKKFPKICALVLYVVPITAVEVSAQPYEPTSEYMLMDFEDTVLHDSAWVENIQPANTVMPAVGPKADSGKDTLELAVGEGRGGGNALRVVANKLPPTDKNPKGDNLPGFFVTMNKRGGGNISGYQGYMLPRGVRANRLEMWIKLPEGFRKTTSSNQPPVYPNHENAHIGTYNYNPTSDGWNSRLVESSNWHFYHHLFVRHDKAANGWVRVVINELSDHQRSLSGGTPPHNPTSPAGNYFETMTRIYFDPTKYFTDPEVSYPVKMLVDDIKFTYVPEPKDITVDFPGYVRGHRVEAQRAVGPDPSQVVKTDFQVMVRNNSINPVTGKISLAAHYSFRPELIDSATGKVADKTVTLAPKESKAYTVRVSPPDSTSEGKQRSVGVLFIPTTQILSDAQSTNRSLTNPLIERRASPMSGPHDGFVYSDFITVRAVSSRPSGGTPPDSEGGITCAIKPGEKLVDRLIAQDPDNNPITFSVVRAPEKGAITMNPNNGTFTYTPNKRLDTFDFFWYSVSDGSGSSPARAVWIIEGTKSECGIELPSSPGTPQHPAPRNLRLATE
jgi:hypothetical protein